MGKSVTDLYSTEAIKILQAIVDASTHVSERPNDVQYFGTVVLEILRREGLAG